MSRFFSRYPATAAISALWVLVFAMTAWDQAVVEGDGIHIDGISPVITHKFGDMRPIDVARGQVWRALTATLLHFGIVHLAINLIGMIQLGRMIEEWYGSAQAFLVYITIGLGGNLISAAIKLALLGRLPAHWGLVRSWLGRSTDVPSVGGSVVVCGLVGLIAVVGWRSRTRFGNFVKGQMIAILAFTALLGIGLPILDNLGHAGGAIVGATIGLLHRRMIGPADHPPTRRWAGVLAALVLIASMMAQAQAQRSEPSPPDLGAVVAATPTPAPAIDPQRRRVLVLYLAELDRLYRLLAVRPAARPDPVQRAFARWAYRAGVPPHRTAIIPPWPETPAPLPLAADDRRLAVDQALMIVAALSQFNLPATGSVEAERYRDLLAVVERARFIAPTPADFFRFQVDMQILYGWAHGRTLAVARRPDGPDGPPATTVAD